MFIWGLMKITLILGLLSVGNSIKTPADYLRSTKDIGAGILKKVDDILPSTSDILSFKKQLIAGYPLQVAASIINKVCSIVISANKITPSEAPDMSNISFVLMTPQENYSYPLDNVHELWSNQHFDKNKSLVVIATGWTTNINNKENDIINTLSRAYFRRGNVNIVVIDPAEYIDTLYSWSAFNTEALGSLIGKALAQLNETIDAGKIHLIGHSLGAHVVGEAGREYYYTTGSLISRITGLDPAKPCFNEGESLSGLQRGDAVFVDVIHSNSGILGKRDSTGDVDYYPGGVVQLPPGCISVTCAHARAWEYYAESVLPGNENNFMAGRCTSLLKVKSGICSEKMERMGYSVSTTLKGNFISDVNAEAPFGQSNL